MSWGWACSPDVGPFPKSSTRDPNKRGKEWCPVTGELMSVIKEREREEKERLRKEKGEKGDKGPKGGRGEKGEKGEKGKGAPQISKDPYNGPRARDMGDRGISLLGSPSLSLSPVSRRFIFFIFSIFPSPPHRPHPVSP